MQPNHWLPLTEYALRSGMSISTLRRKIKSNAVEYRMEDGRYLIRFDALEDEAPSTNGFASSDAPRVNLPTLPPKEIPTARPTLPSPALLSAAEDEMKKIREEMQKGKEEGSLQWRALEARVAGIARKLDLFAEQMSELKMLVKIFEERLDGRA